MQTLMVLLISVHVAGVFKFTLELVLQRHFEDVAQFKQHQKQFVGHN